MPIVVQNEVDPLLQGILSYEIGRADFRQRQSDQERQLFQQSQNNLLNFARQRDAELAKEQALRDQRTQPGAFGVRDFIGQGGPGGSGGYGGRRGNSANAMAMNLLGNLALRRIDQQNRQGAINAELYDNQQARMADAMEQQNVWGTESAQYVEEQVKSIQSAMAKQQRMLTPEGRRLYGDLSGKLRSIQKMRSQMRPGDYSKLLGQWLEEYEASGVQDHIEEPPTPAELYEQSTHIIPGTSSAFVVDPATGKGNIQKIELPPTEAEIQIKRDEHEAKRAEHDLKIKQMEFDAWSKWMQSRPDPGKIMVPGPAGEGGLQGPPQVDWNAYNRLLAEWERANPYLRGLGNSQGFMSGNVGMPSFMQGGQQMLPPGQGVLRMGGEQAMPPAQGAFRPPQTMEEAAAMTSGGITPEPPPPTVIDDFQHPQSMEEIAARMNGREPQTPEEAQLTQTFTQNDAYDWLADLGGLPNRRPVDVKTTAEGYPIFDTEQKLDHWIRLVRPGMLYVAPDGSIRRKPGKRQ